MAVFATIAFATFLLEYNHLFAFYKGSGDFAYDFGAFYCGSTYFNIAVDVGEQNAVEFNLVAFIDVFTEIVNVQELVFFSFELLSLDFYDNVHLFDKQKVNPLRRARCNMRRPLYSAYCGKSAHKIIKSG